MITVNDIRINVPASLMAGVSQEALTQVAKNIATGARAKWKSLATAGLKTSRQDYLGGLEEVVTGDGFATVSLLGMLPNLIENGMPATDLRSTLLGPGVAVAPRGQKGKRETAKGNEYYRSIPFRHQTPGTEGLTAKPMGEAYGGAGDAAQIGRDIYKAAKKLEATTSDPYGGVKYGKRLPAELTGILKPHHKTDIYAGMIRQVKTYEDKRKPQTTYTTFRMISTHRTMSVPGSGKRNRLIRVPSTIGWMRTATPGTHFAEKASEHAGKIATGTVKAYLEAVA